MPWLLPTSVESCQIETTRRTRDGCRSGLSSHHELDTLANESSQYCCSVWSTWTSLNCEEPWLNILEVLLALAFLPSYVSLYISLNPSISSAYCVVPFAQYSAHILKDQPINSNHDFWINWNLFYSHQPCWGTCREEYK